MTDPAKSSTGFRTRAHADGATTCPSPANPEIMPVETGLDARVVSALVGGSGLPPADPRRQRQTVLALQRTVGNRTVARLLLPRDGQHVGLRRQSAPADALQPRFEARVTPNGGVLQFTSNRRLVLTVAAPNPLASPLDRPPFAYQYLPPVRERAYGIIRVVAASGVAIRYEGFPERFFPSRETPHVEIFRVQDPNLVPSQGDDIRPETYEGVVQPSDPGAADRRRPEDLMASTYIVIHRGDGFDFVDAATQQRGLRVAAPNLSPTARFAYEVSSQRYGNRTVPSIRVVKTPAVRVALIGVVHGTLVGDFLYEVYQVGQVALVPRQGAALSPVGERLTTLDAEASLSPEQQLLPIALGLMPIVGELAAIGEFYYGIRTGRSFWGGHRLTGNEVELMGLTAALSVVPIAGEVAQGARTLSRVAGRNASELGHLARAIGELNAAQRAEVDRLARALQRGRRLAPDEETSLRSLLRRIRERIDERVSVPVGGEGGAHATGPPGSSGSTAQVRYPTGSSPAPISGPIAGPAARRASFRRQLFATFREYWEALTGVPQPRSGTVLRAEVEAEAIRRYEQLIERRPGREAAIWWSIDNEDYAVVQGEGNWVMGAVNPPNASERWLLIEHFHPERNPFVQLASWQDFVAFLAPFGGQAAAEAGQIGMRVTSRMRYRHPVTGQYFFTTFGFDPAGLARGRPYFMEHLTATGSPVRHVFRNQAEFDQLTRTMWQQAGGRF